MPQHNDQEGRAGTPAEIQALPVLDVTNADVAEEHPGAFDSLYAEVGKQDHEAVSYAVEFLSKVLQLRGVRIDRTRFLATELRKHGLGNEVIGRAIETTPVEAGVAPTLLDEIAESAIRFETKKSSALSFAAGLPGGLAMIGTVPADLSQYYIHAFRVMQKLAYSYGWQSFLEESGDVDDETLGKLAAFLGIMLGVQGASASVQKFAMGVAKPAIQKQIAGKALTKTVWYGPLKQIFKVIGVKVTKDSLAKTVSKVVPVVGGVVSGGLTFVTLEHQAKTLMKHLREIPPPNVDAEVYLAAMRQADDGSRDRTRAVSDSLKDVVPGKAQDALGRASTAVDGAARTAARRAGSLLRRRKTGSEEPSVEGGADDSGDVVEASTL